jgi:hypothetical protein
MPLLDCFTVLVRQCKRLDPDGYELTLELRPKAPAAPPGKSSKGPREADKKSHREREAIRAAS